MNDNKIILKATDEYPNITLEGDTIAIEGVCMPENAVEMFKPVFEVFQDLMNSDSVIEIKVFLRYLNSMSSKQLLRLFYELDQSNQNNHKVVWLYASEDELMKMKGEEMKSILNMDNFVIEVAS